MAETALIAGIACAVVWWVARAVTGSRPGALTTGLAVGLLLLAWTALAPRSVPLDQRDAGKRPLVLADAGYVSSNVCISCHPGEHTTWDASHHSAMTQLATPATVLGSFSGQTLAWEGRSATLERRGDEFWVHLRFLPGTSDAVNETRRVLMTTGSRLFQVYWTSTNEGRDIERLPFAYLIEEQRWIPLDAAFLLPASQEIELSSWERNCSACHTTNPRPRHVVRDAQVSELGIACEACHGPGSEHVEHYGNLPTRYLGHFAEEAVAIVNPAKLDHVRSSQVCGQCHAVRYVGPTEAKAFMRDGYTYRPGDDLEDSSLLVTYPPRRNALRRLVEGDPKLSGTPLAEIEDRVRSASANQSRFWPDGMVRVTGAEYSGLLATACYQRGNMSCLSCHTLHKAGDDPRPVDVWVDDQLGPGMTGDAACLQCHARYGLDPKAHTHHAARSSGSECQNCHMPFTTYGLLKAVRSHTISSPSVQESVESGRPNACNGCHLDKPLGWTASYLSSWYGIEAPDLDEDEREIAASVLWLLRGNAGQRALAAYSMGWAAAREASGTAWMAPLLAELLNDPYDAVRVVAHRSLRDLEAMEELRYEFTAPPKRRSRRRRRALELWEARAAPVARERRAAVLIDEQGQLRRGEIERLLRSRDNRPMMLWE